jgi:outer membrane protein OmpA-like peptidoglycan-associated protein
MANVLNCEGYEPCSGEEASVPLAWVWSQYRGELPSAESEARADIQAATHQEEVASTSEQHSEGMQQATESAPRAEELHSTVNPKHAVNVSSSGAHSHALLGPLVMVAIVVAGGLLLYFIGVPYSTDNRIRALDSATHTLAPAETNKLTKMDTPADAQAASSSDNPSREAGSSPVRDIASAHNEFVKISLPGGAELNVPESGVENRLFSFLKEGPNDVAEFELDRVSFDASDATFASSSKEQLQIVAQILNAFPEVRVVISAYADGNQDNAKVSRLSHARAKGVLGELKRMGVPKSRLTAKGRQEIPSSAPDSTGGAQVTLSVRRR